MIILLNLKGGEKTSKNSTKRTNKFDRNKFEMETRGMTQSQIFAYVMMNDKEKEEFLKILRPKEIQEDKVSIQTKDSDNVSEISVEIKSQVSVLVQNKRGKPLMPMSPRKARKLLEEDKAEVVQRCPFTIRLKYPTGETKQPIYGGIDPGYKKVGFSYRTKKREILSGEVILRTDIPDKLKERKMYRRNRRSRYSKGYRKPGFENRAIKEGWLAPSIQHKLDTYVTLVEKFDKIMPVSNLTIETSPFDTQKMMNPGISGIEYQQGTLFEYEVKEYLLEKWGHKCAYCKKENVPFEKEHIIPTSRGGTNRISNLTMACHDCNQKKGNRTAEEFGHPEIQIMAKQPLKAAAFMNIVRSRLVNLIKENFPQYECNSTYGYITKYNRKKLGIGKTHANDAFVISGGTNQIRCRPYIVTQNRRNNRALQQNRKGFKPSIRKKRYKYSYGDLVVMADSYFQKTDSGWGDKMNKKDRVVYTSKGVFNYGEWIRLDNPDNPDNNKEGEAKDLNANIRDVSLLKYGSGLLFQLPKDKNNININQQSAKTVNERSELTGCADLSAKVDHNKQSQSRSDSNNKSNKQSTKTVNERSELTGCADLSAKAKKKNGDKKSKKLTKKEKKILDMKKHQGSIEDSW